MRYYRRRPRLIRAALWRSCNVPVEGVIWGGAQLNSEYAPYVTTVHGPERIHDGEWVIQDVKTGAYDIMDDKTFHAEYRPDPQCDAKSATAN